MLLQHLPDHTAICFSEVYLQKCCQCRALIPERDIFFFYPAPALHCIPDIAKRSDSLPHPADTRGSPFMPCCAVFFCCRQLFPIHPEKTILSFASNIRKQFSSAPMFAASSRVRILSIPKSLPVFSASPALSCTLLHFCIVFYRRMQIDSKLPSQFFA